MAVNKRSTAPLDLAKRSQLGDQLRHQGGITAELAPRTAKSDRPPLPLHPRGQTHVLLNIAHEQQRTRSSHAALRVVAVVGSTAEAEQVVERHSQRGEVFFELHPLFKWKLIPPQPLPEDEELARVQRLWDANVTQLRDRQDAFDAYRERKRRLECDDDEENRVLAEAKATADVPRLAADVAEGGDLIQSAPDPRNTHGRQHSAVVGIIDADDGVMVNVFAVFDTREDAVRYTKDTLADKFRAFETYVVDVNAWVWPQTLRTKAGAAIPTGYRHALLHDVMTYKQDLGNKIAAYKDQCEQVGLEARVTDVTGDAADVLPPALTLKADDDDAVEESKG